LFGSEQWQIEIIGIVVGGGGLVAVGGGGLVAVGGGGLVAVAGGRLVAVDREGLVGEESGTSVSVLINNSVAEGKDCARGVFVLIRFGTAISEGITVDVEFGRLVAVTPPGVATPSRVSRELSAS
jgi:hypothetical protein